VGRVFEVAVVWVGDLFRNARLLEKNHSFSSNQGSVLKFENFAAIRRMNYFCVRWGFLRVPRRQGALCLGYLPGHSRGGAGSREICPPRPAPQAPRTRWELHLEHGWESTPGM